MDSDKNSSQRSGQFGNMAVRLTYSKLLVVSIPAHPNRTSGAI